MKKLVQIFMLFSLALLVANCLDDNKKNNIVYFFDEPAVIESLNDGWSVIRSSHDRFEVPNLKDSLLKTGDLLWTSFIVNTDEKSHRESASSVPAYYIATQFNYVKVDSACVVIPADTTAFKSYLSDDYTAFIYDAVLYRDYLDKLLFFGFRREEFSDNLILDYELILNPEIESSNNYPTLYIRSKKAEIDPASANAGHKNKNKTVFAFDMTKFIDYYRKHISKESPIGFNLKYKVGVDEAGKDKYREFRSNPIKWNINN
ncbi:MAG: hypothetical protein LBP72_05220 [Dysgonamonadaceae bacterium]|jgi:hypothetical protein|nr:hypothetical protein [Dysgonamonadaceae bacterium]